VPRNPSSADAAASSSRGTSRGSIASSDGRCSPPAADIPAATRNSSHTCGSSSSAFATRTSDSSSSAVSASSTIRRRSCASASAPPTSAVSSSGTICTMPSRPTISVESVSSYTWYGIATYVIIEPANDTPWPM
jgi:hypothetical protein